MGHGKIRIGAPGCISASTVGRLCFGCGFGTKLGIYNRFKGVFQDEETFTEEARKSMEFGSFFEDAVAKFFAQRKGWKIKRCGETAYWSDDMPYFICHPDRLVIGERIALEIKCVSPYAEGWGEEGTEDIPDGYYFQVQSYYACEVPCDLVIVVCMKGNRIYEYPITKDPMVVAEIRRRVKAAYTDFCNGIVPEPDNFDEATHYFGPRVRKDADGVGANDDVMGIYDQLIRIHYDQDKLKTQEEELKTDLMKRLGTSPAFVATTDNKVKRICWWMDMTRKSLDTERLEAEHPEIKLSDYQKTTETRSFRVSYPRITKETN